MKNKILKRVYEFFKIYFIVVGAIIVTMILVGILSLFIIIFRLLQVL